MNTNDNPKRFHKLKEQIEIEIKGISAEIVLGNYMPKDPAIYNDWQEFFHYNDLIHESQLLSEYVKEIIVRKNNTEIYKGKIPGHQFKQAKSFMPVMKQNSLYLRTECAEDAVYSCIFEAGSFDFSGLLFETQDYDTLFKVGKSFITRILYKDKRIKPEWKSATPVGNICVLCKYDNGYLIPVYDAVNKAEAEKK